MNSNAANSCRWSTSIVTMPSALDCVSEVEQESLAESQKCSVAKIPYEGGSTPKRKSSTTFSTEGKENRFINHKAPFTRSPHRPTESRRVGFRGDRENTRLDVCLIESVEASIQDEDDNNQATEHNNPEILTQSPGKAFTAPSSKSPGEIFRPAFTRSKAQSELMKSEKIYHPPTSLHSICYTAKDVDDLIDFLHSSNIRGRDLSVPASTKDAKGRAPIHVLSENHTLASSLFASVDCDDDFQDIGHVASFSRDISVEKKLSKFLLDALLTTNPAGIIWKDVNGYIPFESSLAEWTRTIYSIKASASNRTLSSNSQRKNGAANEALHNMWTSTTMTVTSAMTWAGKSLNFPTNSRENEDEVSGIEDGTAPEGSAMDPCTPSMLPLDPVGLSASAKCSIKLLSTALEILEERDAKTSKRGIRRDRPHFEAVKSDTFDVAIASFRSVMDTDSVSDLIAKVIESIASIPNFVMSVFLIQDECDRDWVLSSSLFKRVVLHRASVGPWINLMLQSPVKAISRCGLTYLHYISDTTSSIKFKEDHEILDAIVQLESFIPSLLALEERQIEEAATTTIVQTVLDKMISKPFAVTVVFCDFFFFGVMVIGFRLSVNKFLLGESPESTLRWIYVTNTGIFYFVIRELGKCVTILEHTRQARVYLWSIWNIADILSTAFTLLSTILLRIHFSDSLDFDAIDPLRIFLAVTTGCLWMRALSLLKSLNIQLATFVLAILQICKDIMWFLIILGALVACFAQMFFTVLLPSKCATDATFKENSLQCSQSEYYLRLYTILGNLGGFVDFNRDTFTTGFSVFLLIFFSFMVVIILLNILIAIVSDSYEKCLVRSHCLFGRARVLLIAELVSFQNLLRSHQDVTQNADEASFYKIPDFLWNRGWSRGSAIFFFLSLLVIFFWLISEVIGSYFGVRYGNLFYSFLSVFVNVLLFAAIMLFLSRGAEDSNEDDDIEKLQTSPWYKCFQQTMFRLLGTSGSNKMLHRGEKDDWKGRLNYLQGEMERISDKSNWRMENQMSSLQAAIAEPNNVEKCLSNFRREIMTELKAMEERNLIALHQAIQGLVDQNSKRDLHLSSCLHHTC